MLSSPVATDFLLSSFPAVVGTPDVRYLLINPPLTDPTGPYHSISYLVGHAESQGFPRHFVIDANIEAL